MLSKKANHIYSNNILCVGDPIVDIWMNESKSISTAGGALNVLSNIKFFTDDVFFVFPNEKYLKYNHSKKRKKKKFNFYSKLKSNLTAPTIVCSDYKKGFLNETKSKLCSNLLIVDSKYCSLPKELIQNCKIKILKHTATDFLDKNFQALFDYTIVTNHSSAILCYKGRKLLKTFTPPKVQTLNCIGAGDVFVAALAFYLHNLFDSQDLPTLFRAIERAIHWASLSTQTPYTSNLNHLRT